MKVERVSYPVMTPSAARGVLEAIYWHPQFDWLVHRIDVLRPIAYQGILRNEIGSRQSERSAANWAASGGGFDATDPKNRSQRHTLALRDVDYVIHASIRVRSGVADHPAKFRDQFRRRVERGQCFSMPYLGCREFSASFGAAEPDAVPLAGLSMDLGRMLLDMDYAEGHTRRGGGLGKPRFFDARLVDGVLLVPDRFAEAA
jgi:CRISPR-associated protein Cas5d